jgi:hypothetical protein
VTDELTLEGITPNPAPDKFTERDMLDLLLDRYMTRRPGTYADRWVRAEHVRSKLEGYQTKRIADFIAADKYLSTVALHGHEVKVSRSDWLTELRDPDKAEAFKRYMHHWWLVVPSRDIVKPGELPEGWGLMVKSGDRLRAAVPAPRLDPEPLPLELSICLMSAAQKTAHREHLHHDAPNAFVGSWEPTCGWCARPAPCVQHQPRAAEAVAS